MRTPPAQLALPVDPEGSSSGRGAPAELDGFVAELEHELLRGLARLGEAARGSIPPDFPVVDLLASALRDEIETAETAAIWLTDEPDLDLRLGLARQVGAQARHFEQVSRRIRELGGDASAIPRTRSHGPMFRYLRGLQTPAERLAAGLAREGVARLRSGLIAFLCEQSGDEETVRLCREELGPDEAAHLDFFRRELPRYALTAEGQDAGRRAAARILQLAEEAADTSRPAKAAPPQADPAPPGR